MSRVFVEIRRCGWNEKAEQAADLADACHNLPAMMFHPGFDWALARSDFEAYQEKYPRAGGADYVAMLLAIEAEEA